MTQKHLFNGQFPWQPGKAVAEYQIILDFVAAMTEVVVTTGTPRRGKLQSDHRQ